MQQGNRYLIARQKIGLNQKEVAEATNLHQWQISKLENGKSQKNYKELVEFYVSKGIDEEWLLQISSDNQNSEWKEKYYKLEVEHNSLKQEHSSLKSELLDVRRELSEIKDRLIQLAFQKINSLEVGKDKTCIESEFMDEEENNTTIYRSIA